MADEKSEISSSDDEQEYNFSEESPDYDMASGKSEEENPRLGSSAIPQKLMARALDNRRILIGIFVFLLLLVAVYRMLVSTDSETSTDIVKVVDSRSSVASQDVKTKAEPKVASKKTTTAAQDVRMPTVVHSTPISQYSSQSNQEVRALSARVSGVEQQNTAILNTLQVQYTQKISTLEVQNSQISQEVKELKTQLSDIKQSFHQLALMLKKQAGDDTAKVTSSDNNQSVTKSSKATKQTGYTVQAIIPGRAWLKSDSGDTVTVAEGDTLKGVGRIVRIDPYDGIVNLDTGHKIITLSYGMGAED